MNLPLVPELISEEKIQIHGKLKKNEVEDSIGVVGKALVL